MSKTLAIGFVTISLREANTIGNKLQAANKPEFKKLVEKIHKKVRHALEKNKTNVTLPAEQLEIWRSLVRNLNK